MLAIFFRQRHALLNIVYTPYCYLAAIPKPNPENDTHPPTLTFWESHIREEPNWIGKNYSHLQRGINRAQKRPEFQLLTTRFSTP